MKRFLSNHKNNPELSPATNQIVKIFHSLCQMCTPINCRAAFRASGLITYIVCKNGRINETMSFEVTQCCKVRAYELSNINDLANRQIQLMPNQLLIYQRSLQQKDDSNTKYRWPIQSYLTKK